VVSATLLLVGGRGKGRRGRLYCERVVLIDAMLFAMTLSYWVTRYKTVAVFVIVVVALAGITTVKTNVTMPPDLMLKPEFAVVILPLIVPGLVPVGQVLPADGVQVHDALIPGAASASLSVASLLRHSARCW